MNNNNLDQVTIQSSKRKKARFNLKHSVDTSFGIGEIQPLLCKQVVPNSTSKLDVTSVVRLDPMVAPTFGTLRLHHNFMFVGMSDLFPKFAALLAQQPVQFGLDSRVPKTLPHIKLKYLSALCMIGAKFTIYKYQSGHDTDDARTLRLFDYTAVQTGGSSGRPYINTSVNGQNFYSSVSGATQADLSDEHIWSQNSPTKGSITIGDVLFDGYNSNMFNIGWLLGWSNDEFYVPTRNWHPYACFNYVDSGVDITKVANYIEGFTDIVTIRPGQFDNNDCVFSCDVSGRGCLVAVQFSKFGQRLFKLLLNLKYGFDLCSEKEVSLAKLLAVYKAWFDSFAPTLYQGWETTSCAGILSAYDSAYEVDYNDIFETPFSSVADDAKISKINTFMSFIQDVANMWYTEEQDFVSLHIRNSSVSPAPDVVQHMNGNTPNVNGVINIGGDNVSTGATEPTSTGDPSAANGQSFINSVLHSQLDSEVLKRLYKVVNRNTIAGRRIKQLLEAQGLGEYCKASTSNFIGHDSVDVEIFDVTSTSDTLERATGKGMYLGEYVGKGVGDKKSKRFVFKNDEFGFIIELAAIVPESGWTNGVDLDTRALEKLDFYNPEYDGLGLEASPKSIVTGVDYFGKRVDSEDEGLDATFGFAPRDTHHKVYSSTLSGNFGLHSIQKAYLPYSFNKFVEVGSRSSKALERVDGQGSQDYELRKLLIANRLPIASPMYRFIGRYAWMGRFMRIFADLGIDVAAQFPAYFDSFDSESGESLAWMFNAYSVDPFLVHNVYLYDYFARMLPIEDSFETKEDGNNGYADMAFGKA